MRELANERQYKNALVNLYKRYHVFQGLIMCGIVGVCGLVRAEQMHNIVKMMKILHHRGPDGHGILCLTKDNFNCHKVQYDPILPVECPQGEEAGTILGHVRLAILDLSPSGLQPFSSIDNKVWISFNGEIYNYLAIRDELVALGYTFRTTSDTEVLLTAYLEWGRKMLDRLDGMYSFVISDARSQSLFCVRDRFGEKPFYYCFHEGSFWFASEIKALLSLIHSPRANLHSLASYLVNNKTYFGEETFFADICQLPASCWMEIPWKNPKNCQIGNYYHGLQVNTGNNTIDYVSQFSEYITHSVRLRLQADVPVGSCLSGGLDSSTIVSLSLRELEEASGTVFNAFTAIPEVPGYSELSWARQVVENKKSFLHEVHVTAENLICDLDDFIYTHDEPVSGLSVYLQYRLMKAAREKNIPVLLDGQGGDELLLGYERLYAIYLLRCLFDGKITEAIRAFYRFTTRSQVTPARLTALLMYSLPHMRRYWRSLDRSGWLMPEIRNLLDEHGQPPVNIFEAQRYEIQVEPLPELLKVEDRNAMRFGVETRLPFLDHKLVEFCLQAPVQAKLNNGWTKWMLRAAMDGKMPPAIVWRKDKKGFEAPEKVWISQLTKEMESILSESPLSAGLYTRGDPWSITKGLIDKNPKLAWRIFCVEKWMRVFNVRL
jgi:asparagine synthase (glutamine-hydrolysing)